MERETIERLAMDRALGELAADTTALFDAYLAEHPEVLPWAESMSQTCARTRAAVAEKTRAVPAKEAPREARVHRLRAVPWRTLARWAAVILISLGIGAGLGRQSRPDVSTPHPVVVQAPPVPARADWEQIMGTSEDSFWQAKALAMVQPKVSELPRPRVARRGFWDRYRQTIKGAEL
ncbi:MAG: anti-sigma factor [Planctomycetota bacterium]|jgi:hypothetical protein